MLDDSLFVSSEIHEKEVELSDGKKHKLHFKELSAIEFNRFRISANHDDDEKRAAAILPLIVASLVTPDGKPAITLEKAAQLKPEPMEAIFAAILEVNKKKT
ncbi:MAG: hypothetical protein H5U29_00250 [Pusillimonas sp.]|nr:hypothetical protein [Pusillimonas sp.]